MVSIIIPVYNQEKYLGKCIDSCLKQTYRDTEIILVNDASTDKSLSICHKYIKADSRIRLVDKKINEGVEKARLTGIEFANSEYLTFIDSDDWLCNKYSVEDMVNTACRTDADYVEIGIQRTFDSFGLISKKSQPSVTGEITQPSLFSDYYLSFFGKNILSVNVCGKLYRKSIFNKSDITPLGLNMAEDEALSLRIFPNLKKIYILPEIGYSYRWGGITSNYNPHFYPDLLKFYKFRRQFLLAYPHPLALDYLKIELKNILLTQIEMLITYKSGTKDDIISWIASEISTDTYTDIPMLTNKEHQHLKYSRDMTAIRDKDANTLYEIAHERFRQSKMKRLIKNIISRIL